MFTFALRSSVKFLQFWSFIAYKISKVQRHSATKTPVSVPPRPRQCSSRRPFRSAYHLAFAAVQPVPHQTSRLAQCTKECARNSLEDAYISLSAFSVRFSRRLYLPPTLRVVRPHVHPARARRAPLQGPGRTPFEFTR